MNLRRVIAEELGIAPELLEIPPAEIKADYALPCFKLGKRPEELKRDSELFSAEAQGGYLNLKLNWSRLAKELLKPRRKRKLKGELILEHTSANPDGPLHIGHFRNSVLGDALARILRYQGYRVNTEFYVNDMGRQIAIAVWEWLRKQEEPKGKPDWWVVELYIRGNRRLEDNPHLEESLRHLMELFERGDQKIRRAYRKLVQACLKGHKQTLEELGIRIDSFRYESDYLPEVKQVIKRLGKWIKREGKHLWVDLKPFGIQREFTLTRADGTTIYPARDLAYHLDKFRRAKENIAVIGWDQKFYFEQLLKTLSLLEPEAVKHYRIVFYQHLRLPEGRISTRKGSFIAIDILLQDAVQEARRIVEERMPGYPEAEKARIAKAVGVGALKWTMLRISPEKGCVWTSEALRFEGATAPYVQYTYARARSVLRKSRKKPKAGSLEDPRETRCLKLLGEFEWVLEQVEKNLRPHLLANYALELADAFNEFYQNLPILNSEKARERLMLTQRVAETLKLCLDLLGIEALERM